MRLAVNIFNLSLVLLLVFIALYANASEHTATAANATATNECSAWAVQDPGSICLLSGGIEGLYYTRDCSNEARICKWKPSGPMNDCEKVQLCSQENPNTIVDCGPWHRVNGVECMVPGTSQSAQKWQRNCVIGGLEEELCSNRPPVGAIF